MRQITVNGVTWDNEIGTISQLAKQVPGGWVSVSGRAGGLPGTFPPALHTGHRPRWDLELSSQAKVCVLHFPVREILQESRKTKGMALKIIQGSKKNHGIIHQDCCSS